MNEAEHHTNGFDVRRRLRDIGTLALVLAGGYRLMHEVDYAHQHGGEEYLNSRSAIVMGAAEDLVRKLEPVDERVDAFLSELLSNRDALDNQVTPPFNASSRLNKELLPKDVVTENELSSKYKTTIWNTSAVRLHVRRKALEDLQLFGDLKAGKVKSLNIILVNDGHVYEQLLTDEQRQQFPRLSEQLKQDEAHPDPELEGEYVGKYWLDSETNDVYIIVAVGAGQRPNPADTHPSPKDYSFTRMRKYPFGGQNPGITLRHEFWHHTTRQEIDLGVDNETLTDYLAIETIRKADRLYQQSGDNSLYYFVFETTEGNTTTQVDREQHFTPGIQPYKIKGSSIGAYRERANAEYWRQV